MSKITGLAVTMFLGVGGLLVSMWTHAAMARRELPAVEEVGLRTGVQTEDSLTFEVLGFKFNRLWIPYWPCSPRRVHESSTSNFSCPEHPSIEEVQAAFEALHCQDPLPPGFSITSPEKHYNARTTGAVDWMGRHEIQLRVTDGVGKLASAELYLDDELVSEATLDDGRIVDRGDESEATLDFFLPWIPRFTVTLITDDRDGEMDESSYSMGR